MTDLLHLDLEEQQQEKERALAAAEQVADEKAGCELPMNELVTEVGARAEVSRRVARDVLRILQDERRWHWIEREKEGTLVAFAPASAADTKSPENVASTQTA